MEGPDKDKERILNKMKDFDSLLDENPFVQKTKAEAEERGRAEGEIQGEVRGLQKAVVIIVEGRFPPLTELAQQRVTQISQPDLLNVLLKQVATARDEDMARLLLNSFAA
jgi:predicted transposase YdaD